MKMHFFINMSVASYYEIMGLSSKFFCVKQGEQVTSR